MKPIEEFKTQEDLRECLKWWKHRLYLDSWIIVVEMVEEIKGVDGGVIDDALGYNTFTYEGEQSDIQILKKGIIYPTGRYCAEKTLVHELLHCKYDWMMAEGGSYESVYLAKTEHKLLEQMAKSLIMAKYDLDFDYFEFGG